MQLTTGERSETRNLCIMFLPGIIINLVRVLHGGRRLKSVQAMEGGLCCVQALAQARVEEATFDASRLVDFAERLAFEGPATQLTPLVRMLRRVYMRS